MCEAELGFARVGKSLDSMVHLAVRLQQVQQDLACQCEVEHFAGREVAGNETSCGQCLQTPRLELA